MIILEVIVVMIRLTTFFSFYLSVIIVSAQPYTYKNFTVSTGLPSSEVYEVFQDKKGFMWFATDNGISRFDGQEFKNLHVKDGLTDPVVFGFQEDDEGAVWLRTYSGKLCYMKDEKIFPYRFNDLLAPNIQNGLLTFEYNTKNKTLYFSVRSRFGKVDSLGRIDSDTIHTQDKRDALNIKFINDHPIIVQTNNSIHIASIIINDKRYFFEKLKGEFVNKVFRTLYWRKKLYISAFNCLLEFDGKKVRKVFEGDQAIISLTIDNDDHFWIGYLNKGAEMYYDDTFQTKKTLDVVNNKSVTCVKQGKDGSFWISTLDNGVYLIPNLEIQHIDLPPDVKVKTVAAGKKNVLVGDKAGVVRAYDITSKNLVRSLKVNHEVYFIEADKIDNWWISSHPTLHIFNQNFETIKKYDGLNIFDITEKSDGTIVGIGSHRIHEFSGHQYEIKNIPTREIHREILIHDRNVFLAGRIGLFTRDLDYENQESVKGFESFKISEILSVNDSLVLVATIGNGFLILNTRTWESKTYDDSNFLANTIYAALIKDTTLWLGTEKGLVNVPLQSLITNQPTFNYYNADSGLDSDIVYFLAATENEIWAFSENDFSIIPDTLTRFASTKPDFYIKEIKCNNEILTQDDLLQLKPEQNNLQIHFGFILFNNSHIQLRYKLNERSPWIVTDNHLLQLSSLAPGTYKFLLQYSPDNYYWYDASIPISFIINPPWYKRWYIYPFAFLIVIIFSYLYIRNRQKIFDEKNNFLKIINEHQEKLIQSEIATRERERNRIAKELHDGVGTNLTAIKLSVHQILQHYNDPMTKEIEDQFQVTITEIKNIIYDLTPPSLERYGLFTAIKNYVSKIKKNIPINIDIQSFGHEVNNFDLNITVFRILQELISNSIKHSKAKNITIHLSTFEDLLSIIYEDDGIGFKYDPIFNGLGLDNIESRIRSLHGTLKFDSGEFGVSYNIDIPISKTIKKDNV